MYYFVFLWQAWFTWYSVSRFIHIEAYVRIYFLLETESCPIICINHDFLLFIPVLVDAGDAFSFWLLWMMLLRMWVCKYVFKILLLMLLTIWSCWIMWSFWLWFFGGRLVLFRIPQQCTGSSNTWCFLSCFLSVCLMVAILIGVGKLFHVYSFVLCFFHIKWPWTFSHVNRQFSKHYF